MCRQVHGIMDLPARTLDYFCNILLYVENCTFKSNIFTGVDAKLSRI